MCAGGVQCIDSWLIGLKLICEPQCVVRGFCWNYECRSPSIESNIIINEWSLAKAPAGGDFSPG